MQDPTEDVQPVPLRVGDRGQSHLRHGIAEHVTEQSGHAVGDAKPTLGHHVHDRDRDQEQRREDQQPQGEERPIDRRGRGAGLIEEHADEHPDQTRDAHRGVAAPKTARDEPPQRRPDQRTHLEEENGVSPSIPGIAEYRCRSVRILSALPLFWGSYPQGEGSFRRYPVNAKKTPTRANETSSGRGVIILPTKNAPAHR